MTDYRLGTVTAVYPATGLADVTVGGTTVTALALGWFPAVNWVVWLEQRGDQRSDWVIVAPHVPSGPTPGQLVATSIGTGSLSSSGTTEVAASSSTAGFGLASVQLSSLRPYRVEISGRVQQSASSGSVSVRVRASTGTVTITSTLLFRSQWPIAGSAGPFAFDTVTGSPPWTPASTGAWNLAVTVQSAAAGTNGQWTDAVGTSNTVISIYAA